MCLGRPVLLTPSSRSVHPTKWSYLYTCMKPPLKSCVSHSYENCRGVGYYSHSGTHFSPVGDSLASPGPRSRTAPLSPLQSAFVNRFRVLPGFGRNHPPSSPLESAFPQVPFVSPLESALTKEGGGEGLPQTRLSAHTLFTLGSFPRKSIDKGP